VPGDLGPVVAVAAGHWHTSCGFQAVKRCKKHIPHLEVVQEVRHIEPAAQVEVEEAERTERELWASRIGYLATRAAAELTQVTGAASDETLNPSGMASRHSSSQSSQADIKTTLSAPVGQDLKRCVLPGSNLLGCEGQVQIEDLEAGQRLFALCREEGCLVPSIVAVKCIRCLPARDRDVVSVTWSWPEEGIALKPSAFKEHHGTLTVTTTADHLLLACHVEQSFWQPLHADDLKPGIHHNILLAEHPDHQIKQAVVTGIGG